MSKPVYPSLENRPVKNTVCLFDVDGPLTPARQRVSAEMVDLLSRLRQKCAIGYISGSDLPKQQEQLGPPSEPVTSMFDFCFAENGLIAYRLGEAVASDSFIRWLGEEKYQKLVKWCLRYISELEGLPAMRGTFVEFRTGMINVSPVGRNASPEERRAFTEWDKKTGARRAMVEALKREFPEYGLRFSIGGQISIDVFPQGWDKTYCLRHIEAEADADGKHSGIKYQTIHFFGDSTFEGGNDYEIYSDPRTTGHSVVNSQDTMRILRELFDL